jgi:hypothetical protein
MSDTLPLAAFLAGHPRAAVVQWHGTSEPAELRGLPRLSDALADFILIGGDASAEHMASLGRPNLRAGGTLALLAPSGGFLGLFGRRGPAGAELAEALLAAGLTELGMATVPGNLRRFTLVWGRAPEDG